MQGWGLWGRINGSAIYGWVRFTDGYDLRMGTIYGWVLFTDGCYLRMGAI